MHLHLRLGGTLYQCEGDDEEQCGDDVLHPLPPIYEDGGAEEIVDKECHKEKGIDKPQMRQRMPVDMVIAVKICMHHSSSQRCYEEQQPQDEIQSVFFSVA